MIITTNLCFYKIFLSFNLLCTRTFFLIQIFYNLKIIPFTKKSIEIQNRMINLINHKN